MVHRFQAIRPGRWLRRAPRRPTVCSASTAPALLRMPSRQRGWLLASLLVLLVSGLVWLALHYSVGANGLPRPLEAWMMRLHGLAGFAALAAAGALAAAHVPRGWRVTRQVLKHVDTARGDVRRHALHQRVTGVALCILGASTVVTAYMLYYFASDGVQPGLGWLHTALGVALAALLWWHRRRR